MSITETIEFLQGLQPDERIVVCGHVRPDGDCIGSTLALVRSLRLAGLNAYPMLADNKRAPEFYDWLEGFDDFLTPEEVGSWSEVDVFIVVDSPVSKRLSGAQPILERATRSLVIDHHPELEDFGDVRFIDPTTASCTQMVWDLLHQAGFPIDRDVATACYAGLVSDTGRFMFTNTTADTLRAAAEMVEVGVDINDVNVRLFSSKSAEALELEALMLERMMILNNGKVTASWLTQSDFETTGARRDEAENIIDIIRTLKGSEVAILVTFGDSSTRVSLRSKTDFSVAAIAEEFGGGGHQAAAGVNWPDRTDDLSTILDELTPRLPGA